MEKLFAAQLVPCKLFLLLVISSIFSCVKEEKSRDFLFNEDENNVETTIDFNLIDALNESNQKTTGLATIACNQMKDSKKRLLVFKIKSDLQKMDSELKKWTEKNLIIIPIPVYDLNINLDSLNAKNSDFYLLKVLENQIKNQITVLDKMEKTAQNIDFKIFILKSKKIAQNNTHALQTISSI